MTRAGAPSWAVEAARRARVRERARASRRPRRRCGRGGASPLGGTPGGRPRWRDQRGCATRSGRRGVRGDGCPRAAPAVRRGQGAGGARGPSPMLLDAPRPCRGGSAAAGARGSGGGGGVDPAGDPLGGRRCRPTPWLPGDHAPAGLVAAYGRPPSGAAIAGPTAVAGGGGPCPVRLYLARPPSLAVATRRSP